MSARLTILQAWVIIAPMPFLQIDTILSYIWTKKASPVKKSALNKCCSSIQRDVNFDYRLQTYDDNQNIENFSKKFISYDQAFLKYNSEKHREAILSRLADQSFKENFGDDNNGKK